LRACPARPGLLDWKMKYIWYTGAGKEKENCWKTTTAQTYKTFKSKMMFELFFFLVGREKSILALTRFQKNQRDIRIYY
jgi:hypothetical protein